MACTALSRSERVVVGVVDRPIGTEREIPVHTRIDWLQEIHPKAEILLMPQPEWLANEDSPGWAKWTKAIVGKPDAVFTSEGYGARWAKHLGCAHVAVDYDRTKFPISGTMIRENPYRYWEWMHPIVRAWFVKRVVLLGTDSTGKTTLSRALAKQYKTVNVPEYGRIFYEGFSEISDAPEKWVPEDLVHIAKIQSETEDWMRRKSGPIMICDTDAFATQLWNWRYYKKFSPEIEDLIKPADLYVVCGTDIPFKQDRYRLDDQKDRVAHQNKTVTELMERNYSAIGVIGSLENRIVNATERIERLFLADPGIPKTA